MTVAIAGLLRRALLGLALAAGCAASAAPRGGTAPCAAERCGFDWRPLGDGIYAAIRREPPGLLEHANSVVIVNDADVVVVDAQMTASATRELIRAIRSVTDKPVRYVINTHWHDDHLFGNAAYAAEFPGVEFVASAATRADLGTLGQENRRQFVAALPDEIQLMRRHLASGKQLDWHDLDRDGPPLDADSRRSLASSVEQAVAYLAREPRTPVVSPGLTVESRLVLHRGSREIDVECAGPAHTRGDVIVWLPRERVLAAGDVVSGIVPMAAATADRGAWSGTLDRLAALAPRTVVPGHGPVDSGNGLLLRTKQLLVAVTERTTAAYRPGMSLADLQRSVLLDDLRKSWSADEPMRQLLFAMFFEAPAVESVYRRLAPPAT